MYACRCCRRRWRDGLIGRGVSGTPPRSSATSVEGRSRRNNQLLWPRGKDSSPARLVFKCQVYIIRGDTSIRICFWWLLCSQASEIFQLSSERNGRNILLSSLRKKLREHILVGSRRHWDCVGHSMLPAMSVLDRTSSRTHMTKYLFSL